MHMHTYKYICIYTHTSMYTYYPDTNFKITMTNSVKNTKMYKMRNLNRTGIYQNRNSRTEIITKISVIRISVLSLME